MAKLAIKKGKTDVTLNLFIQDSSVSTGAGLTGLAYNTASLVCYYVRPGGSATAISLATQTVTGAHSDGGFVEIDSTNMPGWYRLDLPDAVCATGVDHAGVALKGADDMAPCNIELQLNDYTLTDIDTLLDTIDGKIDTVDGIVDSILEDTGTTIPGTITTIDNEIETIDGIVDSILEDTGTTIPNSMALEATLTAIKGTGWSDEDLVAIKAAVDAIDTGGAEDVWTYTSRTLTQSAASVTAAVTGDLISRMRGNSWTITLTGLTLDSNLIQFTVKRSYGDEDSASVLMFDNDTGLLYVNGEVATAGNGSLAYADETVTITLKPEETAKLPPGNFKYGIQSISAAGVVSEPYGGTFAITADLVRATS